MSKKPSNHREPWTTADVRELRQLANGNTPTRVIGIKMQRTEAAVYGKAAQEGISLGPTNQRPYNRRKG